MQGQLATDGNGDLWFNELSDNAAPREDWIRVDNPAERDPLRPLADGSLLAVTHSESEMRLTRHYPDGGSTEWVVRGARPLVDVELVGDNLHLVVGSGPDRFTAVRLTPDGGEVLGSASRRQEPFTEHGGSWEWTPEGSLLMLQASEEQVEIRELTFEVLG